MACRALEVLETNPGSRFWESALHNVKVSTQVDAWIVRRASFEGGQPVGIRSTASILCVLWAVWPHHVQRDSRNVLGSCFEGARRRACTRSTPRHDLCACICRCMGRYMYSVYPCARELDKPAASVGHGPRQSSHAQRPPTSRSWCVSGRLFKRSRNGMDGDDKQKQIEFRPYCGKNCTRPSNVPVSSTFVVNFVWRFQQSTWPPQKYM